MRPSRLLVFGGGFDPPHRGHLALLRAATLQLRPSEALLVPAWLSPTKGGHNAGAADRLTLAELLARKAEVRLDRFEFSRRKRTYAFELLRELRRRRPDAELCFLIGSDSLGTLASWKRPDELRRLATWVVGRRPSAPAKAPEGFKVRFLKGRFPDIASSEIRARLWTGEAWEELVPRKVAGFIRRRGLYGLKTRAVLERTLSKGRFAHTLAVARWARELASRHGLDPQAAALAGLLHDAGRRFDAAALAAYARRRRLDVPAREATLRRAPMLAHAHASADLAEREFGVADSEVLEAIAAHTLGRPGMGPLARLLYVADFSSPDRTFPAAKRLRETARRDLARAFREVARLKAKHVRARGDWTHPITGRVLRYAESLR